MYDTYDTFPLERILARNSLRTERGLEKLLNDIGRWFDRNTPFTWVEGEVAAFDGWIELDLYLEGKNVDFGLPEVIASDNDFIDLSEGSIEAEESFDSKVFPHIKQFSEDRYIQSWSVKWKTPTTFRVCVCLK